MRKSRRRAMTRSVFFTEICYYHVISSLAGDSNRSTARISRRAHRVPQTKTDSDSDDSELPTYSPTQLSEWPEPISATDSHAPFVFVESSDLEPTGSQHCDSTKGSHDVAHFSGDVTEGRLDPDHGLQQEPDLLQEQSSRPESEPEPEPELEQQRPQRVRHPPLMFTFHTLGQPTICNAQATVNPIFNGWHYPPIPPQWLMPMYPCGPPLSYGPSAPWLMQMTPV